MTSREQLIAMLPDIPRWVEARSLLLGDACRIHAFTAGETPNAILVDEKSRDVFVIGSPDLQALEVVLETVDRPVSITAGPEHDAPLTEMFEVTSVRQLLHVLADAATIPEAEPNTDFLAPHLIERIAIPEDLRAKLRAAFEQSVVTAYFVDDQPVAFCYAAATTETLWDVVIETLPAFRRRGCARACARFMIRYMRDAKKHPVWAIAESSPAALELARKLGFGEIDQMVMFQLNARPDANSPGPPVAVPGTPHEHSPSSFV